MKDRIHGSAPAAPSARLLLALGSLTVGLLVTFLGLFPVVVALAGTLASGSSLALVLLVPFGLLGLAVAYHLARGVADQAAAAPAAANPARGDGDAEADDPLRVLQQRYARGEIDEEVFEARMERLLESDRNGGGAADRESAETALE